jgi:hypothetical protein
VTGEQAAKEARETAQVIRMSDYPKKKGALTYPRFRKAEDEIMPSQTRLKLRGRAAIQRGKGMPSRVRRMRRR